MRIERVNHLGVIVDDMDAAIAGFRDRLGLELAKTEVYADILDIAFLPCGDTQVELISPREDDDPAARWLREHGPGIQHVAFEVDDLDAALEGKGILTPPNSPSEGLRVAMILHNGAPVELMQFRKKNG
jgi:methylmalonyl-CoA/ethylmalonyl-CoA epimerase